uniref:Fasciated Ear4 n=1 Tax=Zea mays TaxID=4577 RepID=A0A804PWS5_MAIZE
MHRQPSPHAFSSGSWAEQGAGGYRHGRDGATFLLPELLQRSPNPSSKSSSAATFVPPLAAAHGGGVAAPFGMAPLGVAAADEARFCMTPWSAAAHFENWGDSGIVVTSPLAETASTDVDMGGGGAMAQSVDGHDNSLPACKVEPRDHKAQRRLAQNREAARKSRMRKKFYCTMLSLFPLARSLKHCANSLCRRTLWSWKTAGPSCPILSRSFKGQGSRGCSLQVDAPEIMDAPLEVRWRSTWSTRGGWTSTSTT